MSINDLENKIKSKPESTPVSDPENKATSKPENKIESTPEKAPGIISENKPVKAPGITLEKDPVSKWRIFTFIYGFARPYMLPMILGTFLYCSQMVMFPLMSSVLMGGVTGAMVSGEYAGLITVAINVLGMIVLSMVMVFFGVLLYVSSEVKTTQRLQTGMLRSFMRSGTQEHTHSGERLSMLNTDVTSAKELYSDSLAAVMFAVLPVVFLSIVIFIIDWRIGVYTVLLGILSTAGQMVFAKPIAKISKKTLEITAEATKTIGDVFSGGIIIRVFRLEERMLNIFGRDNEALLRLVNREARIDGARKLVSGSMDILTTGGVFVVGSILISQGEMTLPALMALVALCSSAAMSIAQIGAAWAGMQGPFEAGRRIYDLLDGDNRVEALPDAQKTSKPTTSGPATLYYANNGCNVAVKNLTFAYKDEEKPVLRDVGFTIPENKLAAFVGESGSGKSTLLKAIAGLYKSEGTQISVGNRNLSYDDMAAWRANFAYVDQNCTLFNLTIAENIGLGREGATLDEIKAAAVEANADGFIMELPDGYDTSVGETGGSLSGGQRQRIAIARALLRRAPVLVLDEATSALDAASEREIVETIHNLRANHTILLVTHNLTAIDPDVTYRIEDGRLIAASG